MSTPLIAIFGAAARPDGRPSAALLRRIGYGFAAAQAHPDAPLLCSGGVGRAGPSEASVMAEVLTRRGVPRERLILDEASLDTFQSVVVASRLVRERGASRVVVCSDGYHIPRIRMMLQLFGVAHAAGPVTRGWREPGFSHWARMSLRECAAIPYDLAIVLAQRGRRAS